MIGQVESEKFPGHYYEILDLLGSGGQGAVYLALLKKPVKEGYQTEGIFAAKVITKAYLVGDNPETRQNRIDAVYREAKLMGRTNSQYCIQVREFIETVNEFYII